MIDRLHNRFQRAVIQTPARRAEDITRLMALMKIEPSDEHVNLMWLVALHQMVDDLESNLPPVDERPQSEPLH